MDQRTPKAYLDLLGNIYKHCSADRIEELKQQDNFRDIRDYNWDGKYLWGFCNSRNKEELDSLWGSRKHYPAVSTVNKLGSNGFKTRETFDKLVQAVSDAHQYKSNHEFVDAYVRYCDSQSPKIKPEAFQGHEELIAQILNNASSDGASFKNPESGQQTNPIVTKDASTHRQDHSSHVENDRFYQKSTPLINFTAVVVAFITACVSLYVYLATGNEDTKEKVPTLIESSAQSEYVSELILPLMNDKTVPKWLIDKIHTKIQALPIKTKENIEVLVDSIVSTYETTQQDNNDSAASYKSDNKKLSALIESGDLGGARSLVNNRINKNSQKEKDLAQEHKILDENLWRLKVWMAHVESLEGNYREASDLYLEASVLVEKDSTRQLKLKYHAALQLITHGKLKFNQESLKAAIALFEGIVEKSKDKELTEIHKHGILDLARALYFLNDFSVSNENLVTATQHAKYASQACDMMLPNRFCYDALSLYAALISHRGTRNTISDIGHDRHLHRLNEGVVAAKSAIRHASPDREIISKVTHSVYYIEYHSMFHAAPDEEAKREELFTIFEQYKGEFKDGKNSEIFQLLYRHYSKFLRYYNIELLEEIADIQSGFMKTLNTNATLYAHRLEGYALYLRGLWLAGGKSSYLEEAATQMIASFQIKQSEMSLSGSQINLGVILSDYGRDSGNESFLERAIYTLNSAAKNTANQGLWSDRGIALRELNIVLGRINNVEPEACISLLRSNINNEMVLLSEYLRVQNEILNLEQKLLDTTDSCSTSLTDEQEKMIKDIWQLTYQVNALLPAYDDAVEKVSSSFDMCFDSPPNFPELVVFNNTLSQPSDDLTLALFGAAQYCSGEYKLDNI